MKEKKSNKRFSRDFVSQLVQLIARIIKEILPPHPPPPPPPFNVLLSLSLSDMFHIALAIHGRVPRSETVRRIRCVFLC